MACSVSEVTKPFAVIVADSDLFAPPLLPAVATLSNVTNPFAVTLKFPLSKPATPFSVAPSVAPAPAMFSSAITTV